MSDPKPKPKNTAIKNIALNRRATHDFHVVKRIEAGIVLTGSEVKSCRDGKVQLVDSFAAVDRGELYLHKMNIAEYAQGGPFFNHPPQRIRKLLLHKREIADLRAQTEQQGYTLVPMSIYFKGAVAKVELGLGKGKSKSDKRHSTQEREAQRSVERAVRRSRDYDE